MELTLTPRLRTVANMVRPGSRLADIGTDHAYLPVRLLLDKTIDFAIAADLREGPLEHARETAARYGVSEQVSFRLCDGLTGIRPGEVDTVVIAGMGGETIAAILGAAEWTKHDVALLLQPMTSFSDLRGWLQRHGYSIEQERIAREGERLYTILAVKGGPMEALTAAELWVGKQSDDPLREDYLTFMASKISRAIKGMNASRNRDEEMICTLSETLDGIEKMRKEL